MYLRKILLTAGVLLATATASAQLNGDGYYRIQNFGTGRYIHVVDNRGSINMNTTSADLKAIHLWMGFERSVSNPASVVYIKGIKGSSYDVMAQGTGIYSIIGRYANLKSNSDGTYYAYASESGLTKYLQDGYYDDEPQSWLSSEGNSRYNDYRKWKILPISEDGENYFGVEPEIDIDGKLYATMYAAFPFSFASNGMSVWYISKIGGNMAVIKDIATGEVAESTPVIISCNGNMPADNKLHIADHTTKAPTDNILRGVYFANDEKPHDNQVPYNPSTMRVLGKTSNGKLGFITADIKYLPANKAYLTVPEGTPDELEIVTEECYTTGLNDITTEKHVSRGVYTMTGVKIADNAESVTNLRQGIYIVDGKKTIVR